MNPPLTALVITWNERHNIDACIEAVRGMADEILVVDMRSQDGTADRARELGARVIEIDRIPFVEPARVLAVRQASHDWVLVLDADEIVTPGLAASLRKAIESGDWDCIDVPRANFSLSGYAPHESESPEYLPRCFRRDCMELDTYTAQIHTNIPPRPGARLLRLAGSMPSESLVHLTNPTVATFIDKANRYTSTEAMQRPLPSFEGWSAILLLKRPIRRFWVHFWHRRGIKDGWRGFWMCILMFVYESMILMKQWERTLHEGRLPSDADARVRMREIALGEGGHERA